MASTSAPHAPSRSRATRSRATRSRATRSRAIRIAGLLGPTLLLAAGGGGGGSGTSTPPDYSNPPPLKVLSVSVNRKDDVVRNEPVEIRFSAPVPKKFVKDPTLIAKAVRIDIVTSAGRIPAKGSFAFAQVRGEDDQTRLIFDPTRTVATDSSTCADNPFGFLPLTTYDISIPAPPSSTKFLTGVDGKPIIESYDTFFTTGEGYIREYVQPRYVGVDGQGSLSFDPPRFINGEVPYNARVNIVFSEALDPNSFELGNTISVVNETLTAIQGTTVLVPGTFTTDICGQTWRFAPSFSFGGAGYDIAIVLSTGLKDLAGNPLANPGTIRFRTEVKPGIPTTQVINESFDSQLRNDTSITTADWGVTTPGTLQGGAVTTQDIIVALQGTQYPGGTRTRVRDHPFAQSGSGGVGHDQWIYTQAELGGSGAITAIGWGPSSNALFASTHQKVKVTLGHTQGDALSTNMSNNFDVGTPVKVVDASYVIPQRASIDPPCLTDACAVGYWPLPTFSNFFEYNGKNNLVLDINATLGTNYQITRIFFGPVGFPNRHTFGQVDSSSGTLIEPVVTDVKFTKKRRTTIAQSKFYDSGQNNPDFSSPILSPASQSGGTSMQVEFEGAEGILFPIPGNPNNVVPDPTTYTGFVTNLDQLDGYRFIRFRVTFIANVNTGQVPVLNSLAIPYIF